MEEVARVRVRSRTSWDAVAVDLAAAGAAAWAVLAVTPDDPGGSAAARPLAVAAVALAVVLATHAGGLHRERLVRSVVDDLPGLAAGAGVAVVAAACTGPLQAPASLLLLGVTTFAVGVLARTVLHGTVRARRRLGPGGRRTLVVGAGPVGRRIAESLLLRPDLGLVPVGLVDHGAGTGLRDLPLPLVGGVADLATAADDLAVSDVVVAFPDVPDADLVVVLRHCLRAGRRVHVVPRLFELVGEGAGRRTDVVRGLPLVRLHADPSSGVAADGPAARAAALVQALVAGAALVVLAPVLVVVALALRLETGAPVLVRPTRLGPRGAEAPLVFRTLRPSDLAATATAWRLDAGPRTGPVGRAVRASGLDELPRLLDAARLAPRPAPVPWPLGPPHEPVPEPDPGPDRAQRRAETNRR